MRFGLVVLVLVGACGRLRFDEVAQIDAESIAIDAPPDHDEDGDGVPDFTPVGGYGVVNLYASYEARRDVLLTFGIDNLFDKQYVPYLNAAANTTLALPGITVKGGIQIRFSDAYFKNG